MDGNLVDEKYGINVLTNIGLNLFYKQLYHNYNGYFNCSVYIGKGTGIPSVIDSQLFEPITTTNMTVDTYVVSGMTNYYDSENNLLVGINQYCKIVLDYNPSYLSETEDTIITEFGIGTSINDLAIHSLVYDVDGNPSQIIKKPNQKTYITMFMVKFVDCQIFQDLIDENKYFLVQPTSMLTFDNIGTREIGLPYERCLCYSAYPSGRTVAQDNVGIDSELREYWARSWGDHSSTSGSTHTMFRDTEDYGIAVPVTSPEFVMEDKNKQFGYLVCYSYSKAAGFLNYTWDGSNVAIYIERINLETPEELSTDVFLTDTVTTPIFRNIFGMRIIMSDGEFNNTGMGRLPVNDFDITSLKMYNYQTNEWDIDEEFINDPTYDFRDPFPLRLNIPFKDFGNVDIFVNDFNNIPIISFTNTTGYDNIYATDTWWDPSTFVKVEDNQHVQEELQHKKFWIQSPARGSSDIYRLFPQREINKHAIIPKIPQKEINYTTKYDPPSYGYSRMTSSWYGSDKGWICCFNKLIYPESFNEETGECYAHTLIDSFGSNTYYDYRYQQIFFNDDAIVVPARNAADSNVEYRVLIYFPDPEHPEIDPNTTSKLVSLYPVIPTTGGNQGNAMCKSFSKNGWFYADSSNTKKGMFFNIYDEEITPTILDDVIYGSPIYDTNYLVYKDIDSSTIRFHIYDMEEKRELQSFELPVPGFSVLGVFGYIDRVFIFGSIDGHYWLYKYGITDNSLSGMIDQNLLCMHQYNSTEFRHVDYNEDVFVMTQTTTTSSYNTGFIIPRTDTSKMIYLSNATNNSGFIYNLYGNMQIKRINEGKQLVLLIYGRINKGNERDVLMLLDLGYMLNVQDNFLSRLFNRRFLTDVKGCIYKDQIVVFTATESKPICYPVEYWLPHKVTGTTRTIQAYNNPIKFNPKTIWLEITNKLDDEDND